MDEWGNYHSQLLIENDNDIMIKYSYRSGRPPRENLSVTVITTDGYVFGFYSIAESSETFCNEYGELNEELKRQIINEIRRKASRMRLTINEEVPEQFKEFVEEIKKTYYEFWRY
jgi:CRISPR/Cas system endoribonuclease Cas6 (RAMP superfamily)